MSDFLISSVLKFNRIFLSVAMNIINRASLLPNGEPDFGGSNLDSFICDTGAWNLSAEFIIGHGE
jgi:hypothetical protein